jgi:hypothetical protein
VRREGESPRPRDWPVAIEDPAGQGPLIWISPVPEPKSVKNRMHLDVVGDQAELLGLGAMMVRARDEASTGTSSPTPRATSSASSPRALTAGVSRPFPTRGGKRSLTSS